MAVEGAYTMRFTLADGDGCPPTIAASPRTPMHKTHVFMRKEPPSQRLTPNALLGCLLKELLEILLEGALVNESGVRFRNLAVAVNHQRYRHASSETERFL